MSSQDRFWGLYELANVGAKLRLCPSETGAKDVEVSVAKDQVATWLLTSKAVDERHITFEYVVAVHRVELCTGVTNADALSVDVQNQFVSFRDDGAGSVYFVQANQMVDGLIV